ncbi:XRE family transcriptional regulator [Pseudidiomarina aestuarii]|uniref:XRE family transcriptional regulator n=1 Tax=Pseudidiomarina aestuarii TaxID=624146 RepID=UPI003A97AEBE
MNKENDNELGSIGKRLKQARSSLGLNQTEFAELVDMSMRGYQSNERDISSPSAAVLRKFADLGISPLWLLNGTGKMHLDQKSQDIYRNGEIMEENTGYLVKSLDVIFNRLVESNCSENKVRKLHTLYDEMRVQNTAAFFSFIEELSEPFGSFFLIPVINPTNESMFHEFGSDTDLYHFHPVRITWVRDKKLDPKYLKAAFPSDDSMAPTVNRGDIVIVDERISGDLTGLFLFELNDRVVIRRFDSGFSGITISTDNAKYPNEQLSEEQAARIKKIGKVVRIETNHE